MNSSRSHLAAIPCHESTEKRERRMSVNRQRGLFNVDENVTPGSVNDAATVRSILADSIRKCGKSREEIVEIMSRLSGTEVTERRLNAYTANSREDFRFPLELTRAFCMATGDFKLLQALVGVSGLKVITKTEFDVFQLGREYLTQKRAAENMQLLEKRLTGGEL